MRYMYDIPLDTCLLAYGIGQRYIHLGRSGKLIYKWSKFMLKVVQGKMRASTGSSRTFCKVTYEILIFEGKKIKIEDRAPLYILLQKSIYIPWGPAGPSYLKQSCFPSLHDSLLWSLISSTSCRLMTHAQPVNQMVIGIMLITAKAILPVYCSLPFSLDIRVSLTATLTLCCCGFFSIVHHICGVMCQS